MKLSLFMLFVLVVTVNAAGMAQKVSLSLKNVGIEEVFTNITKQTQYRFMYSGELIREVSSVTINVKDRELNDVLDRILTGHGFKYEIIAGTISVSRVNNWERGTTKISEPVEQQDIRVSGVVMDELGEPLQNASVVVKNNASIGVTTDTNGQFSLSVPPGAILVVSYVGYTAKEINAEENVTMNITLTLAQSTLDDVVVTALGISREKKSLGYSVTEVKGETLTQAREVNVGNSLVGKVAGLNVNSVSGGPGSAVNIRIRGMSSLSQSNQPLYVIDGIPMTNETSQGRDRFRAGPDPGDNISNINPDDIQSISVLKGAAASALYGSRAKAGVILITTKRGEAGSPARIEFNSNYVIAQAIDQTNFQYEYGQGTMAISDGNIVASIPTSVDEAMATGLSSWGPKINGQEGIQADGVVRPYAAATHNVRDFYQTGGTWTNTLAFTKGFDQGSVRFSASNLSNTEIMPNAGLNRQTFNLNANYKIAKGLNLDVRANYILQQRKNQPRLGDISGNINNAILLYANTIDLNDFKDVVVTPGGAEFPLNSNSYVANPWFYAKHYENNTDRNRLISSATLRYDFDNGLFIQARAGRDAYNDRYKEVLPTGTAYSLTGSLSEQTESFNELNTDVLAGMSFDVGEDITISPNVGASLRHIKRESFIAGGTGFSVPYVYYLGNVPNRTVTYGFSEEESQSIYGTLEFNYKDILYLTGTGRNDWFSTLAAPDGTNPVAKFYPSISGSFVFSEFLDSYHWLSFGKIRAGFAQVGQATTPYQTQLTYGLGTLPLGTSVLGNITGSSVPNKFLLPSLASELEIGADVRLFSNRLGIDVTWYRKSSTNEIVDAPISSTSGYASAALNVGEIRNTGIEALITAKPIRGTENFSWTTFINGSINQNEIVALAPGTPTLVWATARRGPAFVQHTVGLPAAQVVAVDYARNDDGSIQINPSSGLPIPGNLIPMGSAYAKWIAGWSNEFSYKNINFSFLIDGKFGGKIYSNTKSESYTSGKNKETLVGRDQTWGNNLTAQDHYRNLTNISSLFVEDASFIKLRQVIIGYRFPTNFLKKVEGLNVSLVGRNLVTLMKRTTNIDPESAYSGEATGLEMGSLPAQRTFGINLSASF